MFCLVDCNNFYVSCERLFQPRLCGQAVVVLSSNDGNVVARSAEAKDIGIAMGERSSVLREFQQKHDIHAFSSNYTLYGDISNRVTTVLRTLIPTIEPYSIDESFGLVPEALNAGELGHEVVDRIARWCGMPVCVGVGPTKVTAKIANRVAKKRPQHRGVFCFPTAVGERDELLAGVAIEDVWGIAGGFAKRLARHGIATALDFLRAPGDVVQAELGIVGRRLHLEMHGESCMPLEEIAPSRQTLTVSGTFGQVITDLHTLRCAVSAHVERAAAKMRRHGLTTRSITVFFHSDPWVEGSRSSSGTATFVSGTDDTARLLAAASELVRQGFENGVRYAKAGIHLLELEPASVVQMSLFTNEEEMGRQRALRAVVDTLNQRCRGLVQSGATIHRTRPWEARARNRTPCWSTRWTELPIATA